MVALEAGLRCAQRILVGRKGMLENCNALAYFLKEKKKKKNDKPQINSFTVLHLSKRADRLRCVVQRLLVAWQDLAQQSGFLLMGLAGI